MRNRREYKKFFEMLAPSLEAWDHSVLDMVKDALVDAASECLNQEMDIAFILDAYRVVKDFKELKYALAHFLEA